MLCFTTDPSSVCPSRVRSSVNSSIFHGVVHEIVLAGYSSVDFAVVSRAAVFQSHGRHDVCGVNVGSGGVVIGRARQVRRFDRILPSSI